MKTTEETAEMVLRAVGSSLKHFTPDMQVAREALLEAVKAVQHDAMTEGNCGECVHHPTERKVPEIGERLRKLACRERRSLGATRMDMNTPVGHLADILADHFEKETP